MSIKEIYELIFLSKRNEDDNDRIRTAIEENLDIINNDIVHKNIETQNYIPLIISSYTEILIAKASFRKALIYANRAMLLWEENLKHGNDNSSKKWYIHMRFARGIALHGTDQVRKAKEDFEWLTNQDPENDVYRNWLINSKNAWLGSIANLVFYAGCVVFGTVVLLPREERTIKGVLFIVIGIAYIVYAILKIIQWYRNKGMKAK